MTCVPRYDHSCWLRLLTSIISSLLVNWKLCRGIHRLTRIEISLTRISVLLAILLLHLPNIVRVLMRSLIWLTCGARHSRLPNLLGHLELLEELLPDLLGIYVQACKNMGVWVYD